MSGFISCPQIYWRNRFIWDETSIVTGVFVVKYTLKNILYFHSVCALEFLPEGMTLNSSLGSIISYCMAIWALVLLFDLIETKNWKQIRKWIFKQFRSQNISKDFIVLRSSSVFWYVLVKKKKSYFSLNLLLWLEVEQKYKCNLSVLFLWMENLLHKQ